MKITLEISDEQLRMLAGFMESLKPVTLKPTADINKIKNCTIKDLCLSARTQNCLYAADITTLRDLVSHSKMDMMKLRNMGRLSVQELDDLIHSMGLDWGIAL